MKIHFRLSDERLITPTGISLVGQLLANSNFIRIINRLSMEKKRSQPQIDIIPLELSPTQKEYHLRLMNFHAILRK